MIGGKRVQPRHFRVDPIHGFGFWIEEDDDEEFSKLVNGLSCLKYNPLNPRNPI